MALPLGRRAAHVRRRCVTVAGADPAPCHIDFKKLRCAVRLSAASKAPQSKVTPAAGTAKAAQPQSSGGEGDVTARDLGRSPAYVQEQLQTEPATLGINPRACCSVSAINSIQVPKTFPVEC